MATVEDYKEVLFDFFNDPDLYDWDILRVIPRIHRELHPSEKTKMEEGLANAIRKIENPLVVADAVRAAYSGGIFSDVVYQAVISRRGGHRDLDREIDNYVEYRSYRRYLSTSETGSDISEEPAGFGREAE